MSSSEEPECIGICDYDPDSGICLCCGRLPECSAAAGNASAGGENRAIAANALSPAD
jgi:predicted Fe-S protein YdhL (DUF1289 family)